MSAAACLVAAGIVFRPAIELKAQSAPQSPPAEQTPVFRGGVNFVSVDVYPRRDGLLVEGLETGDFQVFEDGKLQKVETFEFVRIEPNPLDSDRRDPTNQADGDQAAANPHNRVFVVYLDTAHTALSASHATRQPVVDFLARTIGPNDVFAFMNAEIPAGQMVFGRRVESIDQQLERYWTWGQADRMALMPNNDYEQRLTLCGGGDDIVRIAREDKLHTSLENLVVRLRDLRDERKSVLFISEGWVPRPAQPGLANRGVGSLPEVGVGPGGRIGIGSTMQTNDRPTTSWCDSELGRLANIDFEVRFRALLQSAARANVSFYPIDTGGLKTDGRRAGRDTLSTLAENTDGLAIVDTNDLGGAMRRIEKDLSAFYLLGYYSSNGATDGRFRQIEVKVSQPGVSISARRGYLAPTAAMVASAARAAAGPSPVDDALGHLARIRPGAEVYAAGALTAQGVVVSVELSETEMAGSRWRNGADVRVALTAQDGTSASATGRIESGARGGSVIVTTSPEGGPWQASVQISGSNGAAQTQVEIAAPPATLVGLPIAWRGTPSPRVPLKPLADYQLRRTERLRVEWPVLNATAKRTARLLDRRGQPLGAELPFAANVPAERQSVAVDLPIAALPEGDYVMELVAVAGERTERRLTAFRVVR